MKEEEGKEVSKKKGEPHRMTPASKRGRVTGVHLCFKGPAKFCISLENGNLETGRYKCSCSCKKIEAERGQSGGTACC